MVEKKTATKKAATKATEKKATAKAAVKTPVETAEVKAAPAKKCAKKTLYINAESVGFRAGDVYQALAAAGKSLTVCEIAKTAKISESEVLLGLGWLFKEGKVRGENVADLVLA